MAKEEYDESEKGLSIAALVCGILALILSITAIGIVPAILAVTCGAICIYKKKGVKGLAVAGLVLGIIGFAGWIAILILGAGVSSLVLGAIGAAVFM